MGVKLMVSIWPSVNVKGDNGREMKERGLPRRHQSRRRRDLPALSTPTRSGRPTSTTTTPPTPRRATTSGSRVKASYWDIGVRIFWLDACEPEIYPWDFANMRFAAGTGAEVACIYPMLHEQGFYEHMRAAGQKEVVNLCRSGWAGSQRFGAAIWSGDIPSTWETLRSQVRAGLNIMMSGIPWWTTDIGGFYGGRVDDPEFRELFVRWFQWGLFCPLFRLHGVREPRSSGGAGSSGAPNEVWSYGDEVYGIVKGLLEMPRATQALHHGPDEGRLREGHASHAAALLRLPGRRRVLGDRGRAPLRARHPRRAGHGERRARPQGVAAGGRVVGWTRGPARPRNRASGWRPKRRSSASRCISRPARR